MHQLTSDQYPAQLREIPEVPERLYVRGSLPPAHYKYLTVVGSRSLSDYGRSACHALIRGLAGHPISIVSGLALGADAVAHEAALSAGLHTVAFPGSGLAGRVIAPRTNYQLAHDILSAGGALVSEYEPDAGARPWMFPQRNRLMVGIADAVLMIEAGERSGTLITARLACEYNRDLLCVPHRIDDEHGYGAHLFMRLGATPVTESAHILEALSL
ncbi:MAG: DNA-processing protein DprA [Patescibacteria group bacterium]